MNLPNISLFLAAFGTALMAGLFYSYSCSVNTGLSKLTDIQYLSAMQNINRAILNPAFLGVFIGTLIILPISAYLNYTSPPGTRFWLIVAAAIVYAAGLFGVTMLGNVPLNEMLDTFTTESANAMEIAAKRKEFEGPWNRLHLIRTIAVVISLALILAACLAPVKRVTE